MSRRWIVHPPWPDAHRLADALRVTPLVAQVLYNRGLSEPDGCRRFLQPKRNDLSPPEAMPGAEAAAEIIVKAVGERTPIVIYGDYDVDGVTGSSILWRLLRIAGADVDVYIPHRLEEGYGLNAGAVRRLAEQGRRLFITVDCGATAVAEVTLARELGMSVIVTDHHAMRDGAPPADAVVHPGLGGDADLHNLCGAAVAFKLAWAVARLLSGSSKCSDAYREFLVDSLALVALGTIADVVPLVGENRVLARYGLAGLQASTHPGFRALLESAGLSDDVDAGHVGFVLGPRLNAAGRMGHARLALELLTRADEARAKEIALYLNEQNRQRQTVERRIAQQARELVRATNADSDASRGIVLASEGWHAGVVGIVASRIVEEFHRPSVLIAIDNGGGQGSGRSIRNFNLFDALTACAEHLDAFGGHTMAGGLRISAEKIDGFRQAFVDYANRTLTASDLIPTLRLDAIVSLPELSFESVAALTDLGPFGIGNPKPKLQVDGVELSGDPRCVGKKEEHLQFSVRQNGTAMKAIAFRMAEHAQMLRDHRRCDLAFEPILNSFRGQTNVEMQVIDIRPAAADNAN